MHKAHGRFAPSGARANSSSRRILLREKLARHLLGTCRMNVWQKPSFEEWSMNAEIGAYQGEDWGGGERFDDPYVQRSANEAAPAVSAAAQMTVRDG